MLSFRCGFEFGFVGWTGKGGLLGKRVPSMDEFSVRVGNFW